MGTSPAKREDRVLVTGKGCFTDDVALTDPLHICFVRSPVATGDISHVDCTDAQHQPGVVAVHTGVDVAHLGNLSVNPVIPVDTVPDFPVLAHKTIRATGQPVAAVLADTRDLAQDGADLVDLSIDDQTARDVLVASQCWSTGDFDTAIATAAHVVTCSIRHPRLAPSPMEPRAIAVAYAPDTDTVTVWHSTQTPHRTRSELAAILNVNADRIRVIAPHVGGAFGMKASLYPEDVFAVWAAFRHKRDVKWTASRSEEFLSATHGRGVVSHGTLAVDNTGAILALKADIHAPLGAWVPNSGLVTAWNAARVLPSGYRVASLEISTRAIQTNHAPTGIYRGAGRPEANCLMERLVDKAARAVAQDPVAFRCANLHSATDLPHDTATGNTLDSGDYARALTLLRDKADYAAQTAERDRRQAAGELAGLGIAFYVEPSGSGWESATVTLHETGAVTVASGSSSQGHGRETAFAQIAADALDVDMNQVAVRFGDTATAPEGIGALASRSTPIGGSAVLAACTDIAKRRAKGEGLPITASVCYENTGQAWGYGAYLVTLSIDRDTGVPTLERIICVDDTGTIVNPQLVKGQILGGIAQGIGEAMLENVVYDADGQLLTGSFMDYAMPRATDMAPTALHSFEIPSPTNILGAKGVGEAGTIGAPAAILNAAIDALSPLGVTDLQMPLTSETLWRAIRTAEPGHEQGTDQ
ncbi:xanthine dehydrogenase family protein molybdopterin-binding subunit [Phaeobacter marinintestinus]|uniref:xanthine dehydrogenase family protein molybdopterin-binding subunit n=1 Tax=Falsiphaeobacter marinintestinus TaxID=1492905 RepID=UPI0011B7112C|nr:xanthine dehydrogenase family protein molybdopterin-binding subunit [Phaeobacter marinintestinus]